MSKKLIVILAVVLLVLSACAPDAATPTPTTSVDAPAPAEVVTEEPQELPAEPEAYPEPALVTEPNPYPEPPVSPAEAQPEPYPYPYPAPADNSGERVFTITDDLGRSVVLSGIARRIVTLGPSSLESLFAIGAGSRVVGRDEYSVYPEEALAVASIGSLWGELPLEAILALEPDLVLAPQIITAEQIQVMEDLGLTVYFQANPVDFEGLFENLRDLAALTGYLIEAETLIMNLEGRVQAVQEKIMPLSYGPSVFYELDATDPENPYTVGAGTMIDTIIAMAGGYNIGQVLEGDYAQLSSEEIIVQNPAVIILADALYGTTPDVVAARPGWDAITAVQQGQVYEFDPFLLSVPGPRLVDGLEAMAKILHPGVFE
jgi:iron complex transport system substrate-binding protein